MGKLLVSLGAVKDFLKEMTYILSLKSQHNHIGRIRRILLAQPVTELRWTVFTV